MSKTRYAICSFGASLFFVFVWASHLNYLPGTANSHVGAAIVLYLLLLFLLFCLNDCGSKVTEFWIIVYLIHIVVYPLAHVFFGDMSPKDHSLAFLVGFLYSVGLSVLVFVLKDESDSTKIR